MRALTTILIISFFSWTPFYSQHKKEPEPLSDAELQQIRDRLPCLKPGITVTEAFALLGVNIRGRSVGLNSSGPVGDMRDVYQLTDASNENGHNLIIVTDGVGKFKRGENSVLDRPSEMPRTQPKGEGEPERMSYSLAYAYISAEQIVGRLSLV
jgi:hypothetical protein